MVCSELAVVLVETQVHTMLSMQHTAQTFAAIDRFSAYRPAETVQTNPAAWWRYVCSVCVLLACVSLWLSPALNAFVCLCIPPHGSLL